VAPDGAFIVYSTTDHPAASKPVTSLFLLDEAGRALGEPLRSPVGAITALAVSPKAIASPSAVTAAGWLCCQSKDPDRQGGLRLRTTFGVTGRPAVHLCVPPGWAVW
jgi:hypothetical protein